MLILNLLSYNIFEILWGSIITDLAYQTNYWLSFPSSNSDILLGLTMWQYWWWFWFTYYITMYYFLFLRLIRHRVLKFSPKISTSQKSHGKWGDFIICAIPITWCVNILSNSNFILRMLEWQTETSLFTIRVRGRQWYWVYKIELKDLLNAPTVVKNLGHNNWDSFSDKNLNTTYDNINLLQIKRHGEDFLKSLKLRLESNFKKTTISKKYISNNTIESTFNAFNINKRNNRSHNFTQISFIDTFNNSTNNTLNFKLNFADNFKAQAIPNNLYFVLKQKRYAAAIKKVHTIDLKKVDKHLNLINSDMLVQKNQFSNSWKWTAKRLKYKAQDISSVYNRRLLRTKRILVIPTHVNLTIITNSFDVVHSWYIPGLGIKLDCIPGRSTHHTLFIDHAGFYYGQCAEICGRFHHHMPIRICALPFEHFLIWWYHYGLPYFNAINVSRKMSIKNGIRQYTW